MAVGITAPGAGIDPSTGDRQGVEVGRKTALPAEGDRGRLGDDRQVRLGIGRTPGRRWHDALHHRHQQQAARPDETEQHQQREARLRRRRRRGNRTHLPIPRIAE